MNVIWGLNINMVTTELLTAAATAVWAVVKNAVISDCVKNDVWIID